MPSDGALVVRALGYWAGWLYFARRFGWPPPDGSKNKSKADAGGGGKKQPDKGTKAPVASKDVPKAAAPAKEPAPTKAAPTKVAPAKAAPSKAAPPKTANSKADGNKKTPGTSTDATPKALVEPVAKQAESTSNAAPTTSLWNLFDSTTGTAKQTSKDWPKETGLHEWKCDDAGNAGKADQAAPSK